MRFIIPTAQVDWALDVRSGLAVENAAACKAQGKWFAEWEDLARTFSLAMQRWSSYTQNDYQDVVKSNYCQDQSESPVMRVSQTWSAKVSRV